MRRFSRRPSSVSFDATGLGVAEAHRLQATRVDAVRDQVIAHCRRAVRGQGLVARGVADVVGVTGDAEPDARQVRHVLDDPVEAGSRLGLERGAPALEEDALEHQALGLRLGRRRGVRRRVGRRRSGGGRAVPSVAEGEADVLVRSLRHVDVRGGAPSAEAQVLEVVPRRGRHQHLGVAHRVGLLGVVGDAIRAGQLDHDAGDGPGLGVDDEEAHRGLRPRRGDLGGMVPVRRCRVVGVREDELVATRCAALRAPARRGARGRLGRGARSGASTTERREHCDCGEGETKEMGEVCVLGHW
jgi:hypothetical protein